MNDKDNINKAIELAYRYGTIDGAHHKMWVIDQMCRILLGDKYKEMNLDGEWNEGIPP
jgi:hypothetical protein